MKKIKSAIILTLFALALINCENKNKKIEVLTSHYQLGKTNYDLKDYKKAILEFNLENKILIPIKIRITGQKRQT